MRFTLRDSCLVAVVLCNLHIVLSYDYEDIRSSYLARRAIDGTRGSKYYNPHEDGFFDDYSYDRGQYGLHQHKSGTRKGFSDIRRNVPGEPSVDYPTYERLPATSFSCEGRARGYYADEEAGCQAFHVCDELLVSSFLCPIGSLFSQEFLTCDWWNKVDCSLSRKYFELNRKIYAQDDGDEMLRKAIAMTGLHTGSEDYYVPEPEVRTRHSAGKAAVYTPYERTANDLLPNYVDFASQGQARGSSRSRLPFTEEARTEAPKDVYSDSPIIRIRDIGDDQQFTLHARTRSSSDGQSGVRRPVNEYGNEYQPVYAPTVPTVTTTTRRYYSPTVPIMHNRVTTPAPVRLDEVDDTNPYDRVLFDSYGEIATPSSIYQKRNETDYGDISPYNFDFEYEDMESRESIGLAKSNSERQLEKEEEASKERNVKNEKGKINEGTNFGHENYSTTPKTLSKEQVLTREEQDSLHQDGLADETSFTERYESKALDKTTEAQTFHDPEIASSSSDLVNIRSEERLGADSGIDQSAQVPEHSENLDTKESISLVHAKIEGQLQLFGNQKETHRHINPGKTYHNNNQEQTEVENQTERTSTTFIKTFDSTVNLQPPEETITSTISPRNYTFSLEIELEPPIKRPSEILEPPVMPITIPEPLEVSKPSITLSVTPSTVDSKNTKSSIGNDNNAPVRSTSSTSLSSSAVSTLSSSSVSSSLPLSSLLFPPRFLERSNVFSTEASSPISVTSMEDDKNVPFQISLQFNPQPDDGNDANVKIDFPGHMFSQTSSEQNNKKLHEDKREQTNFSTPQTLENQHFANYENHRNHQETRENKQSSPGPVKDKSFENFGARITSRNRGTLRNTKRKIIDSMDPQSVNSGLIDRSTVNKNVNHISRPDRLPRPFRPNDRKRNSSSEIDDIRNNFYNHFTLNRNSNKHVDFSSNEPRDPSVENRENRVNSNANTYYTSDGRNETRETSVASNDDQKYITDYYSNVESSTSNVENLKVPTASSEVNLYATFENSTENYDDDGKVQEQTDHQQSNEYFVDSGDLITSTSTDNSAENNKEEFNRFGLTGISYSSTYNPYEANNKGDKSSSEFFNYPQSTEDSSEHTFDNSNTSEKKSQDEYYSNPEHSNVNKTFDSNESEENENEENPRIHVKNLATEESNADNFEQRANDDAKNVQDSSSKRNNDNPEVSLKRTESFSRDEIIDQLEKHFGRPLFDDGGRPIFELPKEKRELDFRSGLPFSEPTAEFHESDDDASKSYENYDPIEKRRNDSSNHNATMATQIVRTVVETEVIPSLSFELDSDQGRQEYVDAVLKGIVTSEGHVHEEIVGQGEGTSFDANTDIIVNNNDDQHDNNKDNEKSVVNVSSETDSKVLSESE